MKAYFLIFLFLIFSNTHVQLTHTFPFNPNTNIVFSIQKTEFVNLKIYNIFWQEVASLVDETLGAGSHSVVLNADNLSTGVYFYRIQAGDFVQTRKLTLLR